MKADIKIKYPIGVNKDDMYQFVMKSQLELEIISPTGATDKQIFLEGGKVTGTPAKVAIKNLDTDKVAMVEGVIVKDSSSDGIYVVPKQFIEKDTEASRIGIKTAEDLVKSVSEIPAETVKAVKEFDTEKTLGFTNKQLLVMAVTVLVIIKIMK